MAWIVEDGTGLNDANCYMNADDVRAYALARGVVLPAVPVITPADPTADPPVAAVLGPDPITAYMNLAMDYLASLDYQHLQAVPTQALAWPRKPYREASDFFLPVQLGKAQAQLVIEQFNGIDLFASKGGLNQGGGFVTMEKVDVLETRYSEKIVPFGPDMPAVTALLRDLVSVGIGIKTVRV